MDELTNVQWYSPEEFTAATKPASWSDEQLIDTLADAITDASNCLCGKSQPLSYCEAEAALAALEGAGYSLIRREVVDEG